MFPFKAGHLQEPPTMLTIAHSRSAFDMHAFAERLRLLREQRGLTQVRLAELLGMTPRSYNRWERGGNTPHLDMLIRIADVLQVSLDELVGRAEPVHEPVVRNPQLHELIRQADGLPDEDQQALVQVMDGLIKKSQLNRVLSGRNITPRKPPRVTARAVATSRQA